MHGDLALVHVTALQLKVEQGASMVVLSHAPIMALMLVLVQVAYTVFIIVHLYGLKTAFHVVEGVWSGWATWSSCSSGQSTRSRTKSHTGGVLPCSGNVTETESCCTNAVPSISYAECYMSCTDAPYYVAENTLTDNVPESVDGDHIWSGDDNVIPSKFRISFSCAKMISSVTLRNSYQYSESENTKDFDVKVREPNSNQWKAFISGTLTDPNVQSPAPLETFSGTPVTVEEVEFTCKSTYDHVPGYIYFCALNYIGFA